MFISDVGNKMSVVPNVPLSTNDYAPISPMDNIPDPSAMDLATSLQDKKRESAPNYKEKVDKKKKVDKEKKMLHTTPNYGVVRRGSARWRAVSFPSCTAYYLFHHITLK